MMAKNLTRKLVSSRPRLMMMLDEVAAGSQSYRFEPGGMTIDLADADMGKRSNGPLTSEWGGASLFRLTVKDRDKRGRVRKVRVWLSARISGDSRARSQRGIHVAVSVGNRDRAVVREIHVDPARGFVEERGCGRGG